MRFGLTGPRGKTGPQGPQGPQGETGATGPQGPAGLSPIVNTLSASAQFVAVDGLAANVLRVTFFGETNAASSRIGIALNGETSQTGYTGQFTIGYASSTSSNQAANDWNVLTGGVGANVRFSGKATIVRYYNGSETRFVIHVKAEDESGGGHSNYTIKRIISGNIPINAVSIINTQANGLKAGAKIIVEILG